MLTSGLLNGVVSVTPEWFLLPLNYLKSAHVRDQKGSFGRDAGYWLCPGKLSDDVCGKGLFLGGTLSGVSKVGQSCAGWVRDGYGTRFWHVFGRKMWFDVEMHG